MKPDGSRLNRVIYIIYAVLYTRICENATNSNYVFHVWNRRRHTDEHTLLMLRIVDEVKGIRQRITHAHMIFSLRQIRLYYMSKSLYAHHGFACLNVFAVEPLERLCVSVLFHIHVSR